MERLNMSNKQNKQNKQTKEMLNRLKRPAMDTITFNVNTALKLDVFDILKELKVIDKVTDKEVCVTMTMFLVDSMEELLKREQAIKETESKKGKRTG